MENPIGDNIKPAFGPHYEDASENPTSYLTSTYVYVSAMSKIAAMLFLSGPLSLRNISHGATGLPLRYCPSH